MIDKIHDKTTNEKDSGKQMIEKETNLEKKHKTSKKKKKKKKK